MKNKTLQIVRHAKSSWDYEGITDIDRPLKSKGMLRAYQVSGKLKLENQIPQIMISSPANRALHTAIIFARILDVSLKNLFVSHSLYDASTKQIVDLVMQTSDEIHSLMIFGHNPGFTGIVNHLGKNRIANLPTAGVVTLVFETDKWENISRNNIERQVNHFEFKGNPYRDKGESL
ncbi:MAG: histidine phosphatase family protein [Bacteroidales bacterium]|nr:histidine phosphatase family protein [Bacteroidales bacterium]